jgi:thiamine-phosphate pyrophosphorylase
MRSPIICLVTGGGTPSALVSLIREAAIAGVDLVQIREPALDDRSLLTLARQAIAETRGTDCRIVVNDRVDVALASGAAGVHLRGESFPEQRVRTLAPGGFLIGRSVHDVPQAEAAAQGGCSYLIFGTVFPSRSKPAGHPISGLAGLREVCTSVRIPVIAIGGISVENASQAFSAGARGVAAIDLFRSGEALSGIVPKLRRRFDT